MTMQEKERFEYDENDCCNCYEEELMKRELNEYYSHLAEWFDAATTLEHLR